MRFLSIIFTSCICASAYLGDLIVFNSKYSSDQVFRALADTTTHGIIGFFSALLFFSSGISVTTQAWIYNVLFCTAVSSLIDTDHFIVAKSIHFKDLTNLTKRGVFHNTTFCLALTTILLVSSYISRKLNIYLLAYMFILAFTSHHLRDGNRRGIWLYPYTNTEPLGKVVYVTLICVLPCVFAYMFNYTKPVFTHKVVHYSQV